MKQACDSVHETSRFASILPALVSLLGSNVQQYTPALQKNTDEKKHI
jgi:hypothetical protein